MRTTLIKLTAAALVSLTTLAACGDDTLATQPVATGDALVLGHFDVNATQALSGQASDTTRQRTVITDAATWTRFWASLKPDPNANALPSIDFARDMVIAVSMPVRPSAGYSIKVEKVTELADRIEAEVVERSPAPECGTLAVITRPFDVVQLPRRDKPVKFVERTAVNTCGPSARADTVRVAFGQTVDAHGLRVTLRGVPNDSRCPAGVYCIWEGDASAALRFTQGAQTTDVTLHTSAKAGIVSTTVGGAEWRLIGLTPLLPQSGVAPKESDYTAVLVVR